MGSRRTLRFWIMLVALFIAASGVIIRFDNGAGQARAAKDQVHSLAIDLREVDGIEWRLVAGEEPRTMKGRLAELGSSARRKAADLAIVVPGRLAGDLVARVDAYLEAVDAETAALDADDLTEAAEIDERRVDPSFDALTEVVADAEQELTASASADTTAAKTWTLVALGGSLLMVGFLFSTMERLQRRRIEAERAAETQRLADRLATDRALDQARTDDLTGLLNRRGFNLGLDEELGRRSELSVLMVDLNGFKEVNDSLGHQAGDLLLSIVAQRFARVTTEHSHLARLGGDEFSLVVCDGAHTGQLTAERMLATLAEPFTLEGTTVRIGASIGIATAPAHGSTSKELMRAADVAMYDAKSHHLGAVAYAAENDPHSRGQLELIEDLRTAIDHRSFDMHYQPTISVTTGEVVGMEALIRWNHPTRGMLPPELFIPLAERIGLIPAITQAVLDISIADLARTHEITGRPDLRLSINISALDLVNDDLPRYVKATLDAHGVPADLVTLEITETAISADSVRASKVLHALRSDGVRISIDDFGVGYSSMSQLLELPLDELKIDRSFIANLDSDLRAQAILSATVELGRTLGLEIVAEGIETAAALDEVARRGVGSAQGFWFSAGLPATEIQRFIAANQPPASGADSEGESAGRSPAPR